MLYFNAVTQKPESGTTPAFFYLGLDKVDCCSFGAVMDGFHRNASVALREWFLTGGSCTDVGGEEDVP